MPNRPFAPISLRSILPSREDTSIRLPPGQIATISSCNSDCRRDFSILRLELARSAIPSEAPTAQFDALLTRTPNLYERNSSNFNSRTLICVNKRGRQRSTFIPKSGSIVRLQTHGPLRRYGIPSAGVAACYMTLVCITILISYELSNRPQSPPSAARPNIQRYEHGKVIVITPYNCKSGNFEILRPAPLNLSNVDCGTVTSENRDEEGLQSGDSRIREIGRYFRGNRQ